LILNVILDILLIPGLGPFPVLGINGAAIGSLVAIIVNVLVVGYQMKKVMPLKVEGKPVLHIILASLIMGLIVYVYTLIVPLSNIWLTLIPVLIGAIIYFIVLLKIDKSIHDDIRDIVMNFGFAWPKWL